MMGGDSKLWGCILGKSLNISKALTDPPLLVGSVRATPSKVDLLPLLMLHRAPADLLLHSTHSVLFRI